MGEKDTTSFLLMNIILAIVFIGLILLIFELHRFFLIGEVIILVALIIISFVASIAVFNGIKWGWGILSLSFAVILIDLLIIYFATGSIGTTFFITMVLSAIGFIFAVTNMEDKVFEDVEETTTEFKPEKYITSKRSSYYHAPKCDWAKKIKKKNQVWLSEEDIKKKKLKKHSCLK